MLIMPGKAMGSVGVRPRPVGSEPDISVTDNLHSWWRSDKGITLNGADVSNWADEQGNGDLVQATAQDQPLLVASQINGHDVLRFDGTDHHMVATFTSIDQPFTVWMLIKALAHTVGRVLWFGRVSTSALVEQNFTSPIMAMSAGGGAANQISPTIDVAHLVQTHFSNVDASSYQETDNDGHQTGGAGTFRNLNSGFTLCSSAAGASTINCEVAEVAIYTTKPSADEEASLKAYFSARYALGF